MSIFLIDLAHFSILIKMLAIKNTKHKKDINMKHFIYINN